MNDKLTSKYFKYKEKNYNSFISTITRMLKVKPCELWENKTSFSITIKPIVEVYVESYLYGAEKDYNKINKYFNLSIQNNRIINNILLCIINYFENNNKIDSINGNKDNILYATIVIYLANSFDKLIKPYEKFDYNNTLNKVIEIFKNINILMIYETKRKDVEKIVSIIELNCEKEKRFLNSLECNISYNKYRSITSGNAIFYVKYIYILKEIEKYKAEDVKYVFKNLHLEDELFMNCYELLNITLLKQTVRGLSYQYVIPITSSIYNKNSNMKKINKIFCLDFYKKSIMFIINYKDYIENRKQVENLENDYKIIINLENENEIDPILLKDKLVFGEKELLERYKLENTIEKKMGMLLTENELLNIGG